MTSETDRRIDELEKTVRNHDKMVWVVVTVAIVFGLSGGWGAKVLTDLNVRLTKSDKGVTDIEAKLASNKTDLSQFTVLKKNEIDIYFDDKVKLAYSKVKEQGDRLNASDKEVTKLVKKLVMYETDFSKFVLVKQNAIDKYINNKVESASKKFEEQVSLEPVSRKVSDIEMKIKQLEDGNFIFKKLNARKISIKGEGDTEILFIGETNQGGGLMELFTSEGHPSAQLVSGKKKGFLLLYKDQKQFISLDETKDGKPGIWFLKNGKEVMVLR
jgi:hypothetical protein